MLVFDDFGRFIVTTCKFYQIVQMNGKLITESNTCCLFMQSPRYRYVLPTYQKSQK